MMYSDQVTNIISEACASAIPRGGLTVSLWADQNRMLSPEAAAEPGKWNTDRNPVMREPMDTIGDPRVHTVVLMTSSQVGKSETLNNALGYFIHIDPSPIMFIQPTLDRMKDYSKKRIAPMLRDTPVLKEAMLSSGLTDSDDTVLSKSFTGGQLSMVGANSSSALASQPIRIILADEVDRYPADVDNEGDPLSLAVVRTTTFEGSSKVVITSTPTVKDESRIEQEFAKSDQRHCYVPCPHCNEYQQLVWKDEQGQKRLQWEVAEDNPDQVTSVWYVCKYGCEILPHELPDMLAQNEWRAHAPFNGIAGFFLNALYSAWQSWKKLAEKFIAAKKSAETLKTFVNTMLGETWDRANEKPEIEGLEDQAETYAAEVPKGVLVLTAGVDVQPDRLECEITGWGVDEESWSVNYHIIYGDPAHDEVWNDLKVILTKEYECERKTEDGYTLRKRISMTCVDSGGHHAHETYKFCLANRGNRVFAIKGSSHDTKTLVSAPSQDKIIGGRLYLIGTILAKDALFGHFKTKEQGAGYCHFPGTRDEKTDKVSPCYPGEYFKQLTAEKRVKKLKKFDKDEKYGYSQYQYKKIRARNEALDCRVYAYAALHMLRPNWEVLQEQENLLCAPKPVRLQDVGVTERQTTTYRALKGVRQGRGQGGWTQGWKR
jgi:phage terminase large subunit GpA-like protein